MKKAAALLTVYTVCMQIGSIDGIENWNGQYCWRYKEAGVSSESLTNTKRSVYTEKEIPKVI